MASLPNCDELFLKYFNCWYSKQDREAKIFSATRPDLMTVEELRGLSPSEVSRLTDEAQQEAMRRIAVMLDAARGDWPTYLQVSGDLDLAWIDCFDRHYDRPRIADVLRRSDPEDFANDYVVLCIEFGAALGHVLQSLDPSLEWLPDSPYWESAIFDPCSGTLVPVVHWAIKKMSEYGVDDGFAEKIPACLQMLVERRG